MRTINPANIKSDYVSGISDVRQTIQASENSDMTPARKNFVKEFAFLSAAILLEGFISDLFVAYINRDRTRFTQYLVNHMKIETSDPHAKKAVNLAIVSMPQHLSASQIRSVLDPRDYNVTFTTVDEMKASAGRWLVAPYNAYFTGLNPGQSAEIVAIKTMRNFLAHRSSASKDEMQLALASGALSISLRRGQHQIHNVGSFLRSRPTPNQVYRIQTYLDAFESLGNSLCP
jgi:hypothetical protein